MPYAITCADCGAKRSNAQYKNTRYCHACRMLRDLVFVEDSTRKCVSCSTVFAPVTRRDSLCGTCNYGSIYTGACKFCHEPDAELQRSGVAVCVKCVRDPKRRPTVVEGLKIGQRARRKANNHAPAS